MPIVITATLVMALFGGGKGKKRGSFLNPESIRKRVKNNERALAIVDELEKVGRAYAQSTAASLEAYAAQAADYRSTADALIAQRRPADAAFMRALEDVIRIRQSLLGALTPEEWTKVFG